MTQTDHNPLQTELRRDWEIRDLQIKKTKGNFISYHLRIGLRHAADYSFRYYNRHKLQTNQTINHETNRG